MGIGIGMAVILFLSGFLLGTKFHLLIVQWTIRDTPREKRLDLCDQILNY